MLMLSCSLYLINSMYPVDFGSALDNCQFLRLPCRVKRHIAVLLYVYGDPKPRSIVDDVSRQKLVNKPDQSLSWPLASHYYVNDQN